MSARREPPSGRRKPARGAHPATSQDFFTVHTLVQMVKFGAVGVLNTLLTLAVIFLLTKLFRVSDYAANAAGYAVGLANSFVWNKLWTFKSGGRIARESLLFLSVYGVCYLVQLGILALLIEVLRLHRDISQLAAMAFYIVLGFLGNKLVTFRKGERP